MALTIPTKCDVFYAMHCVICQDVLQKWMIYSQDLLMSLVGFYWRQYLEGWCKLFWPIFYTNRTTSWLQWQHLWQLEHLQWLNWSFAPLIHKMQAISDTTDRILEFWLQILNLHKNLVLVMYNMSYSGVVSSVPFLVIIIVFAPVRTADQIWWCNFTSFDM